MHILFWFENRKERGDRGDLGVDGKLIFKGVLKK
jgi:hypothetical protein